MRFSEAIEYFLSAKRAEGRSDATIGSYSAHLYRFAKWADDPMLSAVSPVMVRTYIAFLQTMPGKRGTVRPASVAAMVRPLKVMCRFLVGEELMELDPFKRVKVPSVPRELHELVGDEDFGKMLAACNLSVHEGRRNHAILCFLYDTGVRVSELVGLKHEHLDTKGRYAKVLGKGAKERVVFFSAHTALSLTRYMSRTPKVYRNDTWVFTSLRRNVGKRFTTNGVGQALKRIAARAGVRGPVNPHAFRHTFATNYLRAGGDLNSLMRLMGHADLTILQTYLSLVTDDLRAKHEQFSPMARVMGGKR